jgi:hypothetical protein
MQKNHTLLFNKMILNEINKDNSYNNCCLITNEPLKNQHVKLSCNHCFNYKPLFKEIKIQKTSFNKYETQRLKNTQIKCPYCRHIQNGILPYNENYEKIKYVNWPENLSYKQFKCCYTFLSGKKKGVKCDKQSHKKYCPNHCRIVKNREVKNSKKSNEIISKSIVNEIINTPQDDKSLSIFGLYLDSFYIKCKLDSKLDNIFPKLHITKSHQYFRCRCQHINDKHNQCKKYVKCSNKISNKKTLITPTFYNNYYCNIHKKNHPQIEDITYSKTNINIDISNVPKKYLINIESFNKYLSKYYNFFFNSTNYEYKKFQEFTKK